MRPTITREPLPGDLPGYVQVEVTRRKRNGYVGIDLHPYCNHDLTDAAREKLREQLTALVEDEVLVKYPKTRGWSMSWSAGKTFSHMRGIPSEFIDPVLDIFRSTLADAGNLRPARWP